MIPDKDYYIDASGKLTDDPSKFAAQVAVAGVLLDERVAKRYGIEDALVSVDEPRAVRRVARAKPEPEPEPEAIAAEEVVEPEAEPEAEEPKSVAAKPVAKKAGNKGAKRK